uniref:Uncharacterized protein n=1 Tax=Ciona intestinalis TaxID=7719 RepID=H2XXP7_CIOIN
PGSKLSLFNKTVRVTTTKQQRRHDTLRPPTGWSRLTLPSCTVQGRAYKGDNSKARTPKARRSVIHEKTLYTLYSKAKSPSIVYKEALLYMGYRKQSRRIHIMPAGQLLKLHNAKFNLYALS